ncbi:MAG: bifunctional (p)ppGpp synthetase/guanosine-3',5'-bis(diphosphate) 3'-pyrophosphohydrolase, partial [Abyssibacter sp.]|nr:bifunctional (p)ppGpp synthetase/guanosine-3',5'-bis(diphosphate) 3'-pyrophosphohydrolase [Abyssibacter sp.]
LERSLDELGVAPRVLKGDDAEQVLAKLELDDMEDLYASIGLGRRLSPLVARLFLEPAQQNSAIALVAPLAIQGTEGLIVEYGGCCHPIPGDPIRGHVSMGRGIVIHRVDCKSGIQNRKGGPHDWVSLSWSDDVEGDFIVELRIQGPNQRGFLATVATEIADAGSSIENVNMSDRSSGMADMRINITIRDRIHLAQVMRGLRRLDIVERVQRS